MKGRQMAMDSLLKDADRHEEERRRREWAREKERTDAIKRTLDAKYSRAHEKELKQLECGTVIIIGQELFRNGHYTTHFYRTVLTFYDGGTEKHRPIFIQADNEEWPDVPPWAQVENHEEELRDIGYYTKHIHWNTGEVTEPVTTWWMKKWQEL